MQEMLPQVLHLSFCLKLMRSDEPQSQLPIYLFTLTGRLQYDKGFKYLYLFFIFKFYFLISYFPFEETNHGNFLFSGNYTQNLKTVTN